jgi:RNA polymerase sigma factor (sigma-70 family)
MQAQAVSSSKAVEAERHACEAIDANLTNRGHWRGDQGDQEWRIVIAGLYATVRAALHRFLLSLGLSKEAAEDVIQESFVRLANQLLLGAQIERLQAWVFQVAYNLAIDEHRAERHRDPDDVLAHPSLGDRVDPLGNPEWLYLQKEKVARVQMAMSLLTPRQFRSLQLRAEGFRYREIAADLGVTEQRAIHLAKRAILRMARICSPRPY